MEEFRIAIFPEGSLDSSVVTTVWIGVVVYSFFNLRFGWAASGLVVPGYLVPLLFVKPWSGIVIIVEAILAYLLFQAASKGGSRMGLWHNLFGRDRFFAILLAGVFVRIVCDGWLLPAIGAYVVQTFNIEFDYRSNLQSFGLLVVALMANQFYKPGLRKGLYMFFVILGITYCIVRFVLIPYTNYNIINLQFMYEGVAESLLSAPKAYIVLLTAAYLASQFNLIYGWDFNGILLPSLLALQLYEPGKLAATFVEAFAIYLLALFVLKLPPYRRKTIEGVRKLMLFFNISFLYKFAVGYLVIQFFPQHQVSDYFGLGYLLPTLMAARMHEKEIAIRYSVTTLCTAGCAALAGNIVGFLLVLAGGVGPMAPAAPSTAAVREPIRMQTPLTNTILMDKIDLYAQSHPDSFRVPLPAEIHAFTQGLKNLKQHVESGSGESLNLAQQWLIGANYTIVRVDERYLYLREMTPRNGWGVYVLDMKQADGILVSAPAALDEWRTLESSLALFQRLKGRALAISGSKRKTNRNGSSDVLLSRQNLFQVFHRELGDRNVLQVRGYTAGSERALRGLRENEDALSVESLESTIWIRSRIPSSLNLAELESLVGGLEVEWRRPPLQNVQRDVCVSGFAELWMNRNDRRLLPARIFVETDPVSSKVSAQRIDGYLQDWLLGTKGEIADRGSNAYRQPREEELLYLDREVLTPLWRLVQHGFRVGEAAMDFDGELETIASSASVLGYGLILYRHEVTGHEFVIFAETAPLELRRYWGTYVFRLGAAQPFILHVIRPLFERFSFEYGVELFERLQARAILISGTHRNANMDGSSDLVQMGNRASLFNLVHQVVLRESDDEPYGVISCRAFGLSAERDMPDTDAVVAFADGTMDEADATLFGKQLLAQLEEDRVSYMFSNGSRSTAGYDAWGLPQGRYMNETREKEYTVLWLSPSLRMAQAGKADDLPQKQQFDTLGINHMEGDLFKELSGSIDGPRVSAIPSGLFEGVNRYLRTRDIIALRRLLQENTHTEFSTFRDMSSLQSFLLIRLKPNAFPFVVNVRPRMEAIEQVYAAARLTPEVLSDFASSRTGWLRLEGGR